MSDHITKEDVVEDALWKFDDDYVELYVTDVDWYGGKVEYTTFDPQGVMQHETMPIHQFKKWTRKDDVYEVPVA